MLNFADELKNWAGNVMIINIQVLTGKAFDSTCFDILLQSF